MRFVEIKLLPLDQRRGVVLSCMHGVRTGCTSGVRKHGKHGHANSQCNYSHTPVQIPKPPFHGFKCESL
jgi:hypothetical protein